MENSRSLRIRSKAHRSRFRFFREIFKNRVLYLMTLPAIILFFLFNYLSMFGILIAFKSYKFSDGILGSKWVTPIYRNFEFFFQSEYFVRVTRNTLVLNFSFIVFGALFAVAFAIILNEIGNALLKRVLQIGMLLPSFISWIVVGVFVYSFLNVNYGVVNSILGLFNIEPVNWYGSEKPWTVIFILINIWKTAGYNSIIYLASITGIDTALFEAAEIDGASKAQQIRFITIPLLLPTVTMLMLLAIGRIMNADFGMFYSIVGENPMLYPRADVIDTFIYRTLRRIGDVGMSSAAGFYQSVLGFLLVLICNQLARKFQEEGSLF